MPSIPRPSECSIYSIVIRYLFLQIYLLLFQFPKSPISLLIPSLPLSFSLSLSFFVLHHSKASGPILLITSENLITKYKESYKEGGRDGRGEINFISLGGREILGRSRQRQADGFSGINFNLQASFLIITRSLSLSSSLSNIRKPANLVQCLVECFRYCLQRLSPGTQTNVPIMAES